MSIIVKHSYLPGFTEPKRNQELEKYLTERGYCSGCGQEGAEIADIFHKIMREVGIVLEAGAEGFTGLSKHVDHRNKIIASCAKHNCMSAIWWEVECECERRWSLYSGIWNDELGFMVLDAPSFHPIPLVWLTKEHREMRIVLDLNQV